MATSAAFASAKVGHFGALDADAVEVVVDAVEVVVVFWAVVVEVLLALAVVVELLLELLLEPQAARNAAIAISPALTANRPRMPRTVAFLAATVRKSFQNGDRDACRHDRFQRFGPRVYTDAVTGRPPARRNRLAEANARHDVPGGGRPLVA